MNTLKSAAVLVVAAGVLYGVYVTLNKPEAGPPIAGHEHDHLGPPQVEMGGASSLAPPVTSLPAPPTSLAGGPDALSPADLTPADPTGSAYQRSSYEMPDRSADSTAGGSSAPPLSPSSPPEIAPTSAVPAVEPTPAPSSVNALSFRRDLAQAEQHVAEGKFRTALATLSPYYHLNDLGADERPQLLAWLDALAGKVIYSREHLLDSPYRVQGKKESLYDIADKHHVPWQLLANINGVADPLVLVPGTELKVVPGPMRAEVSLTTSEVTMYLGDLYAGRFPFSLGLDGQAAGVTPLQPGTYKVLEKSRDRTYYGNDGRTIPANDPTNPYGQWWINLDRGACLHGSPAAPSAQTLGCMSLSPQDAKDVYGMLVIGSTVTIKP
jgi:hypothetical protein